MIYKYLDENENGEYDAGEEMLEDWEFTVTIELRRRRRAAAVRGCLRG